jgi:methylmalonyl-CoA/ethylmalonyl-CoA epimerase
MRLHHIGKVVSDLEEAVNYYKDTFGLSSISLPVEDSIQRVEVVFIETGFGRDLTIELIRPLDKESPVRKFLEKGGGLHHLCFEVEDINRAIEDFNSKGALVLGRPVPGRGHNDKLTVWLYTAKRELIELIEKA